MKAIAIPALNSVRRSGDRTKCVSNLRQIGTGIAAYTADRDGYLPGPLWTWQSCWYDSGDFGSLATVLAPYLGLVPEGDKKRADVFLCPSWQKGAPYRQDELFIVNTQVMVNGEPMNPWGDADVLYNQGGKPSPNDDAPDRARKLISLADVSLPQTWAIQDLDEQSPFPKGPTGIAKSPVHGDVRNALFFDFHVEAVPVKPKP